jgi:hypothetical protein
LSEFRLLHGTEIIRNFVPKNFGENQGSQQQGTATARNSHSKEANNSREPASAETATIAGNQQQQGSQPKRTSNSREVNRNREPAQQEHQ